MTFPYAYLCELEHTAAGSVEQVATVFLKNSRCPFTCLMCDLWRHTTDTPVAPGDIPAQIDFALAHLPPATQIKLYNSGNFFDHRAIPPSDYPAIAQRLGAFNRVIVENHPRLCGGDVVRFRDLIGGQLEVAMGLETIHPEVLPRLNKRMTLDDFARTTDFLLQHGIAVRAFILLRPPFMDEAEGIEWAVKSVAWAFDRGVACCAVIPTRPGNPPLDALMAAGQFSRPSIRSLEVVLEASLAMRRGRVFVDLWDAAQFYDCPACGPARKDRLHAMNLSQRLMPAVECGCG